MSSERNLEEKAVLGDRPGNKSENIEPIIRLEGVAKTYPGSNYPAVDNLTLKLEPGEFLALLGPSGCGKTTTLRVIAGFERPDKGRVILQGQPVAGSSGDYWQPPEKRRLGVVFQDYALFPHLTAAQNIEFGLRRLLRQKRKERVKELLELTGLTGLEQRFPHQLSGGQQQRVAIARAMAPRPVALLLDEAFNSLDAASRSTMHREVRAILKAEQVSAILVTHDQAEAFALADRVAVMNQGKLEQLDQPLELYRNPATRFVAGFIGQSTWLPGQVVALEAGEYKIKTKSGLVFTGLTNEGAPLTNFKTGDQVEVLLRPEDVNLLPAGLTWLEEVGQHYKAIREATILSLEFRGSSLYYTLALMGETALIKCEQLQSFSSPIQRPGTKVMVCFRQSRLNIFPQVDT